MQVSTLDQTENHVLMCMVLYAFLVFGNLKDTFVKDRSAAHVAVQAAGICLQQSTYTHRTQGCYSGGVKACVQRFGFILSYPAQIVKILIAQYS